MKELSLMLFPRMLLSLAGFSFGMLVSAGVFTVLLASGMVTRFAGKLGMKNRTMHLENMVVLGTLLGGLSGVFPLYKGLGSWGIFVLACYGFFAGIFVGCLAMTIAEVLDAIPIFARRLKVSKGVSSAVFSIAFGKVIGSLLYFVFSLGNY